MPDQGAVHGGSDEIRHLLEFRGRGHARDRRDHGPKNLTLLRRFALNFSQANSDKGFAWLKLKRAG